MEKLSDIFHIRYGHQLDLNKQIVSDGLGGVNFISRTSNNLGVKTKIKKHPILQPFESGSITVALGGSVMSAFVQLEPFYTAQNIKVLTPKGQMSFNQKLYYCICLRENAFLYSSHGREANKTLDEITVPSLEEIPDWVETIKATDLVQQLFVIGEQL